MKTQYETKKNLTELWTALEKCDLIDSIDEKELLDYIYMTKQKKREQELLKSHIDNFYHIWQNEKGVFLTYLPAPDKPRGRKPVTASTREKLERKIIDFYLARESEETRKQAQNQLSTLRAIYPLWLKMKSLETNASTYIRRIDTDWNTYYLNDPIIDKDIRKLTKVDLKEWALIKIREKSLTKKQYYNMTLIIRHSLDYAVERELIPENPFNAFKIDGKLFRKVKKPEDSTQVFLTTERPLIEAEAWRDFNDNGYTTALAIPLAFQTGVRLGELTALKSSDICRDGKYLHIQRMAQKVERQRPDGKWYPTTWTTVEHAKTSAGDRYVYLTKEARRIIQTILTANEERGERDNDFLFLRNGEHVTPTAIISRIRKYCNGINTSQKGIHKIRKTYISSLLDAGININEIRKQVGHEDEHTTLHNYCFNRSTQEENEENMEKALAG